MLFLTFFPTSILNLCQGFGILLPSWRRESQARGANRHTGLDMADLTPNDPCVLVRQLIVEVLDGPTLWCNTF